MSGDRSTAATDPAVTTCPACGETVRHPCTETREDDFASYVVVVDPGNSWHHVRDAHPDIWAQMCEARQKMNANPYIGGMPRKVNGTFLGPGEDVGDLP